MKGRGVAFVFVAAFVLGVAGVPIAQARTPEPPGLVAVSGGHTVEVVSPVTGAVTRFDAGPVGWLFPGPGGVLFAPDLVDGTTLVIDLRKLRIIRRLKGVTMPHFGPEVADRYIAVAGDVLVLSYPERAMIARIGARITRPWQVLIAKDWTTALILERTPGVAGPPVLWAIDLVDREVLRKTPLDPDVTSMAFSQSLGVLAFATGASGVRLVDPATLATVRVIAAGGVVKDVAFSGGGSVLLAAVATGHTGTVECFHLKVKRKGLAVSRRKPVTLAASPARLAVAPGGVWAVVATNAPALAFFKIGHKKVARRVPLSAAPRDVEWCDVARPGPLMPEWSK
ncbi:MAG: hypothetical protein GXP48_02630 [Acidobacteria bacterium]|nr:hypothetical protein [Acidobacteriota bacterium]